LTAGLQYSRLSLRSSTLLYIHLTYQLPTATHQRTVLGTTAY